jgi:phage baseplate assembly protein W
MSRATRAESLTTATRKTEFYSDFVTSFAKSPVGNQLARVVNEKSINQALKNLIFTNLGERLFQPYIGSNIYASLFENNTQSTRDDLTFYIDNTIRNNEPRVHLIDVDVVSGMNENELVITIVYQTINNPDPIKFEYILKRVR